MMDRELTFSNAQALTATANSTDLVDALVARNFGAGAGLYFIVSVSAKGASTPTIKALLVGADDSAFTSNKITIYDTGTLSDPALGFVARVGVPAHTPKRYYRVEYTLGGGGGSPTFTVTAGFADMIPSATYLGT